MRGVSSLGLRITVLPAMSAGMTSEWGMAMGKFHGVMHAATP